MWGFLLRPFRKRFGRDSRYYRLLYGLGLYPNNIELYKLALLHRSASMYLESGTPVNNERLEFLGDAILEGVVSDYLFVTYPQEDEGFLTKMRSKIVNRATLNELAVLMGLDRYIVSSSSGSQNIGKHINGDAMEAVIGAIYLDKGYDFTNRWLINRAFSHHLDIEQVTATDNDHKSRLIEWCQKSHLSISFRTSQSRGGSSQHPLFQSHVFIGGDEMGYGYGDSKKEAEQCAAYSVSQALSDSIGDFLLESMDNHGRD